jgi:hypothetical protein
VIILVLLCSVSKWQCINASYFHHASCHQCIMLCHQYKSHGIYILCKQGWFFFQNDSIEKRLPPIHIGIKFLLQENWKLGFQKKRILKRQLKFNCHVSRFKQRHIIYLFWDWFSVAKDCDLHGLGIALSIRWPSFGGIFF